MPTARFESSTEQEARFALCNSSNLFRIGSPHGSWEPVHSNPRHLLTSAIILCCLTIGLGGGVSVEPVKASSAEASTGVETKTSKSELRQLQQANTTPLQTSLSVNLSANGSGSWTVEYRFTLNDANETTAFDQLQTNITSNPNAYQERFQQRMASVVATAENTTGREMEISDVRVHSNRNGSTGIVTYEFRWRNFATATDDRLRIDEPLTGLSLDNETRLTIRWPAEYEAATVRPTPTEQQPNAVTWAGATDFTERGTVVEIVNSNSTTNTTSTGTEGASSDGTASGSSLSLSDLELVVLVVLLGGLGIVWGVRRWQTETTPSKSTSEDGLSNASDEIPPEGDVTDSDGEMEQSESRESTDEPPLELLSNEEQVITVLKRAGGRAKQQHIVNELGWTAAKTSSVVSRLRDEGTIEGFRLGRENVLSLPDNEGGNATDDSTEGR